MRATSLELNPSGSLEETGRLFLALNILSHFRFGEKLVPTWIVPAPPAVSMGTRRTEYQKARRLSAIGSQLSAFGSKVEVVRNPRELLSAAAVKRKADSR